MRIKQLNQACHLGLDHLIVVTLFLSVLAKDFVDLRVEVHQRFRDVGIVIAGFRLEVRVRCSILTSLMDCGR